MTERPMTPAMMRVAAALRKHGPMTGKHVAARAFVSFWTFKNNCVPVLVADGLIHQSGWQRYKYGFEKVYSAGTGETPPRPAATRSNAERSREWKQRTGYSDHRQALRRLRRPPCRVLAALMGVAA